MRNPFQCESGAALLLCTFFIALVLVAISTLSVRVLNHAKHSQFATAEAQAFAAAESALSMAAGAIAGGGSGSIGYSGSGETLPGFNAAGVELQSLPGQPGVQWFTVANQGLPAAGFVTVRAFARANPIARGIEAVYRKDGGGMTQVSWREVQAAVD